MDTSLLFYTTTCKKTSNWISLLQVIVQVRLDETREFRWDISIPFETSPPIQKFMPGDYNPPETATET